MKLVFRTVLVITVGVIALVPSTLAQTLDLARDGETVNSSRTACINVKVAKGKQARLRAIADTTEKGQQLSMKWDGRTVCGGMVVRRANTTPPLRQAELSDYDCH